MLYKSKSVLGTSPFCHRPCSRAHQTVRFVTGFACASLGCPHCAVATQLMCSLGEMPLARTYTSQETHALREKAHLWVKQPERSSQKRPFPLPGDASLARASAGPPPETPAFPYRRSIGM